MTEQRYPHPPSESRIDSLLEHVQASRDLAVAIDLMEEARLVVDAIVMDLREDGHTWKQIGDKLGITRQAAHDRFAHRIEQRGTI